jgi:DNA-binding transcriptional LysR family regulator
MSLNDRIVDVVDEGFDLAVRIGRLADSSLIARRIAQSQSVVCGAPGYFRQHGVPLVPDDLLRHNCLIYSYATSGDTWRFTGPDTDEAVRVTGNFWANNGDSLRVAALGGLGVLLTPRFIVCEYLRSGRLEAVLGDYAVPDLSIYAVYPHNRHLSAKLRVFVDFLVKRFGSMPDWNGP